MFDLRNRSGAQPSRPGNVAEAADLGRVADRGAGGVAFEQRDVRRRHPGGRVGRAQCTRLSFFRRDEKALAASVVGKADAAQHRVNRVAVALRIGEALERDEAGAFRGDEAVGVGVEGRLRPLGLIAPRAEKPTWMNRSSAQLTAPASMRSARPS